MSKILPGIPPYVLGGWEWLSITEAQRSDKVITAAKIGNYQSRVCHPRGVERVAGEGIKNAVEMGDDQLSDHSPEDQSFSQKDLPYLIHKWVWGVCEQNFARDSPLLIRGVVMVLHN